MTKNAKELADEARAKTEKAANNAFDDSSNKDDLHQRLWEETMRKGTIEQPLEILQQMNTRVGELTDPEVVASGLFAGKAAATAFPDFPTQSPVTGLASSQPLMASSQGDGILSQLAQQARLEARGSKKFDPVKKATLLQQAQELGQGARARTVYESIRSGQRVFPEFNPGMDKSERFRTVTPTGQPETYHAKGSPTKPSGFPNPEDPDTKRIREHDRRRGRPKVRGGAATTGAMGAAGIAALGIPLVIAGGEALANALGTPEGDKNIYNLSKLAGGPLKAGSLDPEVAAAFKDRPNDVARFLQAGIFSPDLARELAPDRVAKPRQGFEEKRKQAVNNALNREN